MSIVAAVFENLLEFLPITVVEEHEIGVYLRCGRYKKSIGPGAYRTVWPFEKIITVNAQAQNLPITDVDMVLGDGRSWSVDAGIAYTIESAFKYMLQTREPDELLTTLARSRILSHKGSNELIENTADVEMEIYGELDTRAELWGIAVLDFRFTRMSPCQVIVVRSDKGVLPLPGSYDT